MASSLIDTASTGRSPLPAEPLQFELGVKTDPILYRYSFDWLFRLLARESVRHVQIGTFFEIYTLPDAYFHDLRRRAADHGITISSVFTAHRELGGFFRDDGPGWTETAARHFERLIDVAGLMGARSVGSNPGAVLRDRMGTKRSGTDRYLCHFCKLMHRAADRGIDWLTIEPMSCRAEPPTLPDEMSAMAHVLTAYHAANPHTARPGYCVDVAHGYADEGQTVIHDHFQLMRAAIPMTSEIHLKNTDPAYNSTFGFGPADRQRGIIDVAAVRSFYEENHRQLPVNRLIGYLEIGGPKLGRDYSDPQLEAQLRDSLQHLRQTWLFSRDDVLANAASAGGAERPPMRIESTATRSTPDAGPTVLIAPSIMCADLLNLEPHLARLASANMADLLHLDVMDGHFAPNLALGLTLIEQLRPRTGIPLDVHLMVQDCELFVRELLRIGVERIAVHAESTTHLDRVINQLRDHGVKAGVALNPATPLSALDYALDSLDFVLLMTVNPGFAGQRLCSSAIRKIGDCRRMLDEQGDGRRVPIQVDGNVSFDNIPLMVAAGADELVVGSSSVFSTKASLPENAQRVRDAIEKGMAMRQVSSPAPAARLVGV